jgi:hypothetical protein
MTKITRIDVGTRVERKRDGATGTIVNRTGAVNALGVKTLLSIRLDDAALAQAAGGDMIGDLSWFASYFRAKETK